MRPTTPDPTPERAVRIVSAWVSGWVHSRGCGPPERTDDVLRIRTGTEREALRWVPLRPTPEVLDAVLAQDNPPTTCVKLAGEPAQWVPRFPAGWVEDDPGWFMTRELSRRDPPALPAAYELVTEHTERLLVVRLLDGGGHLAARGRAGLGDGWAVPDQIVTEDGHRRLGLGSVVMAELENAARERGYERAVLSATTDGRALYRRLGWRVELPLVGMYYRP